MYLKMNRQTELGHRKSRNYVNMIICLLGRQSHSNLKQNAENCLFSG